MDDLKLIKRQYGEEMSHLCRELFPTLLETPGLLYRTLTSKFAPSRLLYKDIKEQKLEDIFKTIIYHTADNSENIEVNKTPAELLKEQGYTLYKCETEKDIQSFRHYYKRKDEKTLPKYKEWTIPPAPNGEELCTFRGDRLNTCHVFFAVKEGAENLNREDFRGKESRQDEYGTSVISIQFSRGDHNTLSIKNRYNHTVRNPDATFANNLENIAEGLTKAFEKEYGLNINSATTEIDMPGYVLADDGKYYKYNYEDNNIYYCPDNIIIDNGKVIKYDKSRYLIIDYFILDMQEKTLKSYYIADEFESDFYKPECPNHDQKYSIIKNIKIENNDNNGKTITINGDIVIVINDKNKIIKYKNEHITTVYTDYLGTISDIEEIDLPNVKNISAFFLNKAKKLKKINLPIVEEIGDEFLENNNILERINLPKVTKIGNGFLAENNSLKEIYLPIVEEIGDEFLENNNILERINLPNAKSIGSEFLYNNNVIKEVNIPNCIKIDEAFLYAAKNITSIDLSNVESITNSFMTNATLLSSINLPKCVFIGYGFLTNNSRLTNIDLPLVYEVGDSFLTYNHLIKKVNLPACERIGDNFLSNDQSLQSVNLPIVRYVGSDFLSNAISMREINLPKVTTIRSYFMKHVEDLEKIEIPNCRRIGRDFLLDNISLTTINLPNVIEIGDRFLKDNQLVKKIGPYFEGKKR